jgi:rhodanese-related sulfurtransferase
MRFLSGLFFFLSLNVCFLLGQTPDSVKYQSLEPDDFNLQYLSTGSSLLIDVREPFEFKGKRIKGAINIPSSGNLERAADTLDREYTLFLYCTSGYRSARVAESLYEKGFRKLVSLKGGIIAWKKEGMPVNKRLGAKGKGRRAGDRETP